MNIYVGNLPYSTSEDAIRSLFEQFGEVTSVRIINDAMTGKSKGFCFVDMADEDKAQEAIDALHGSELDGRNIVVNKAREREKRERSGGGADRRPSTFGRRSRF